MLEIDINTKKDLQEMKNADLKAKNNDASQSKRPTINIHATASYIKALQTTQDNLPQSLNKSLNTLKNNLSIYLNAPDKIEEVPVDNNAQSMSTYNKLSLQVISRDEALQEKVASNLSTPKRLVRSRDAEQTLDKSLQALPDALKEGTGAGKSLSKFVCECLVTLTDPQTVGAGLERDLAMRQVFIPQDRLNSRTLSATNKTLEQSIAFIESNQKDVIDKLPKNEYIKDKPGATTPQTMTRYLRKALDEFPDDSTYLDIFKQNRDRTTDSSPYDDKVSEEISSRIHTLIAKAAKTARRGNLIPNANKEAQNSAQDSSIDDIHATKRTFNKNIDTDTVVDDNVSARELSLSELSARAAKLQKQFRQERLRLVQEGKLPNPATPPETFSTPTTAKEVLDRSLSSKTPTEKLQEARDLALQRAILESKAQEDANLDDLNLDKVIKNAQSTQIQDPNSKDQTLTNTQTQSALSQKDLIDQIAKQLKLQISDDIAKTIEQKTSNLSEKLDVIKATADELKSNAQKQENKLTNLEKGLQENSVAIDEAKNQAQKLSKEQALAIEDLKNQTLSKEVEKQSNINLQQSADYGKYDFVKTQTHDISASISKTYSQTTLQGNDVDKIIDDSAVNQDTDVDTNVDIDTDTDIKSDKKLSQTDSDVSDDVNVKAQDKRVAEQKTSDKTINSSLVDDEKIDVDADIDTDADTDADIKSDKRISQTASDVSDDANVKAQDKRVAEQKANYQTINSSLIDDEQSDVDVDADVDTDTDIKSDKKLSQTDSDVSDDVNVKAQDKKLNQNTSNNSLTDSTDDNDVTLKNQDLDTLDGEHIDGLDGDFAIKENVEDSDIDYDNLSPMPNTSLSQNQSVDNNTQDDSISDIGTENKSALEKLYQGVKDKSEDDFSKELKKASSVITQDIKSDENEVSDSTKTNDIVKKVMADTVPSDDFKDDHASNEAIKNKATENSQPKINDAEFDTNDDVKNEALNNLVTPPGASVVTTGNNNPLPERTQVEDMKVEKETGLFKRFISMFKGSKSHESKESVKTEDKAISANNTNSTSNIINTANSQLVLKANPLDQMLYTLKVQANNPNMPPEFKDEALKFLNSLNNPVDDLASVKNWLNFVTGPISPNSSQALAMHQWAFFILCTRFEQLGKEVRKFLKKNMPDGDIESLLKTVPTMKKAKAHSSVTVSAIEETFGQIDRLQQLNNNNNPILNRYIPLPPNYEGGREGGFSLKRDKDDDGKDAWHLHFAFDLKDLGPIEIKAVASLPEIKLSFVTESLQALQKIQELMPELNYNLQMIGITARTNSMRLGHIAFKDSAINTNTKTARNDTSTLSVDI